MEEAEAAAGSPPLTLSPAAVSAAALLTGGGGGQGTDTMSAAAEPTSPEGAAPAVPAALLLPQPAAAAAAAAARSGGGGSSSGVGGAAPAAAAAAAAPAAARPPRTRRPPCKGEAVVAHIAEVEAALVATISLARAGRKTATPITARGVAEAMLRYYSFCLDLEGPWEGPPTAARLRAELQGLIGCIDGPKIMRYIDWMLRIRSLQMSSVMKNVGLIKDVRAADPRLPRASRMALRIADAPTGQR